MPTVTDLSHCPAPARGRSVGMLYKGPLHCLYLTAKTEGPLAWYKGTTAHLARIAPHTVSAGAVYRGDVPATDASTGAHARAQRGISAVLRQLEGGQEDLCRSRRACRVVLSQCPFLP